MKILVTGSKGFIGSALCNYLNSKGYNVVGIDNGFFKKCKLPNYFRIQKKTKYVDLEKDIRNIKISDLKKFNAIIHLAALSNDPIGNYNKKWTEDINLKASIDLAKKAKKAKVKKFLFSSSCIMYGVSKSKKSVTEKTPTDPQTIYAKSKVAAEDVPLFVTVALLPAAPVVTVPTAIVAAAPSTPSAPSAPLEPAAPVAPVAP